MDNYNGWLIVNSYYHPAKFTSLYKMLQEAAEKANLRLSKWTSEQRPTIIGSLAREPRPDFVLYWDKDVFLARALELSGLRLFNSGKAIQLADDKAETALILAEKGIPIVDTIPAPTCFPGCRRNPATAVQAAKIPAGRWSSRKTRAASAHRSILRVTRRKQRRSSCTSANTTASSSASFRRVRARISA